MRAVLRWFFTFCVLSLATACANDDTSPTTVGHPAPMIGSVRRLPDSELDEDLVESWLRDAAPSDVYMVGADRFTEPEGWEWQVAVAAMEFVRVDPLEGELRSAMEARLAKVPGVIGVRKEDTETWAIHGAPSGEDLTRAAAEIVDGFADRILEEINRP